MSILKTHISVGFYSIYYNDGTALHIKVAEITHVSP